MAAAAGGAAPTLDAVAVKSREEREKILATPAAASVP